MKLVYKHYTNGQFVRDLNPISEFSLSEEINKAGSEIIISIPVSLKDTSSANDAIFIVDENDNFIITENADEIIAGTEVLVTGFPNIGDEIKVYQHDEFNPSGKIIFDGVVHRWKTVYSQSNVQLYVRSKGLDLDNYLIQVFPNESIAEQLEYDNSYTIVGTGPKGEFFGNTNVSQTFTVPVDTDITGVYLYLSRAFDGSDISSPGRLELIEGSPSSAGAVLGSVNFGILPNTFELRLFQFSTSISLNQSATYHIKVTNTFIGNEAGIRTIQVYYNSLGGYTSGQAYEGTTAKGTDLYFQILTATGGLGNQFLSEDPSEILKELIDGYVASGGQVNYSPSSVATTNTTVSYTFKYNTYLEGLQKVVELAPPNWYFYVDSATNIVYFDKIPTTPNHYLTYSDHIVDLDIEYTMEQLSNLVYVVGGEVNGVSLVSVASDVDSISTYGQRLSLNVDSRITLQNTADIVAENILKDKRNPAFVVKISVLAKNYDITTIRVGQLIGFRNVKGLLGELELQVVGKVYTPEKVDIYLSQLPISQSKRIEDINRNLKDNQTKDTPAE